MKVLENKEAVDIEKDFLVVHTDTEGKFSYLNWYSAERVTQNEIDKQIIIFNKQQEARGVEGRPAKLITDPFIKGACAYERHVSQSIEVIEEAKEIQNHIDEAIKYLESALADLNRIRGLD